MNSVTSEVSQRSIGPFCRNIAALKRFFEDPRCVEIMLNADGTVWIERAGEGMKPAARLEDWRADALMKNLATFLNKSLTYDSPLLNGELPLDPPFLGARFSGAIPPVTAAPTFSIRKKATVIYTLEDYVRDGIMTERQRVILSSNVEERKNILVVGGTGSGKTTLLNALIAEMVRQNDSQRFFIIEDTGELQCAGKNVLQYHTSNSVNMTDCLKQALRNRPDRILVGEVRDAVALDMLDAWNTGHEGGLATVHANSARAALARLRSLVNRAEHPPKDIDEIIGEVVHLIVFIVRTPTGREIKEIVRVDGYDSHAQEYLLEEIK